MHPQTGAPQEVAAVCWKKTCQTCVSKGGARAAQEPAPPGQPPADDAAAQDAAGAGADAAGAAAQAAAVGKRRRAGNIPSDPESLAAVAAVMGAAASTGISIGRSVGLAEPIAIPLAERQEQLDGVSGWGRSWLSKKATDGLFGSADFLRDVLLSSTGTGAVNPGDIDIVGDRCGARAKFDAELKKFTPGWTTVGAFITATDAILACATTAASQRAGARARAREVHAAKISLADGCWGGGRGPLRLASARLMAPNERARIEALHKGYLTNQLVFVSVPYRERCCTFGPPADPLTHEDETVLATLRQALEADNDIGVLLIEPWRFPGRGGWLTPAVYRSVRTMCTDLGVAIIMDESGSACRTGRFLAHSWLMGDDASLQPDALVLGKGLCAAVVLLPDVPSSRTAFLYDESVTSGGPTMELLQGTHVLRHLAAEKLLDPERQRRLHDACALAAAKVRAPRAARGKGQPACWGTCTAWYFSHLPVRDTNALWMHAHEHYRVVIPLDVAPEKAAEWLQ